MRSLSVGLLAATLGVFCRPAVADVIGYSCETRAPVGTGAILSGRYYRLDPNLPPDESLIWEIKSRGGGDGLQEVTIAFTTPSAGEAPRPATLMVQYLPPQNRPRHALWLFTRMGAASALSIPFSPGESRLEPLRYRPGESGGYGGSSWLAGPAFREAYAAGKPLEIYVQGPDGAILFSRIDPLAERATLVPALEKARREMLRMAADYKTLCRPMDVIE